MARMEGCIGTGDKVLWLCHPDDPDLPDCYIITSHEAGDLLYDLARSLQLGEPGL